jgi:hypothetical protein
MSGIMDFLGMGKQAGDAIAEPVKAVGNVLDNLFTSDDERLSRQEALAKLAQIPHIAQQEVNKLEAQHRSIFVAGWRPSIGWVCSISLGAYYIPQYVLASVLWAKASWMADTIQAYPVNADGLTQLVFALLGMGGIRMMEKMAGKTK